MTPFSNLARLGMEWNLEECWRSWLPQAFASRGDRWSGRIKAPQVDPVCPMVGQVQQEQVGICSASVIGPSHMTLRLCAWPARAFGLSWSPGSLMALTPTPRSGKLGGSSNLFSEEVRFGESWKVNHSCPLTRQEIDLSLCHAETIW